MASRRRVLLRRREGTAGPGGGPSPAAVLFDAVGTLIRPWPSVGSVYAGAASSLGYRCLPGRLESSFHRAYAALTPERFAGGAAMRTSEARERRWWRRVAALTFEEAGYGDAARPASSAALEAFSKGRAWRAYADAVPVMSELAARGVSLAVVSNFDSRLRTVMDEINLLPRCRTLVISSECGWAKPSPRIYLQALEELGIAAERALFVGDRREEDFAAPRRNGLAALRLVRDGSLRGPLVIRSLRQILPRFFGRPRGGTTTPPQGRRGGRPHR